MMPWQGVCVRFVFGSFAAHNGEQLRSHLDQYAKAITARGYAIRMSDTSLTVTVADIAPLSGVTAGER
jgi:hypothetical protein